jgi:dihydropteroate synthase
MESWSSPHRRPLPAIGSRTLVMGVLNATPDSFSDGGELESPAALVARAGQMIANGADVLDLGGESTRPGARPISVEEELARVLPALAVLRQSWPEVPISIDTYKADVADAAIALGADIINDVWGCLHGVDAAIRSAWRERIRSNSLSPESAVSPTPMAEVAARRQCPLIVMHNRLDRAYVDFWADVLLDLETSLAVARSAGVKRHQLWVDPGFGFVKNLSQNLEVLRDLRRIGGLGHPVLVGTSRKSTLGTVLGTEVDDRIEAGGATVVWAIQQGCSMIRVHDVREMIRFARMADAIKAGLTFTAT